MPYLLMSVLLKGQKTEITLPIAMTMNFPGLQEFFCIFYQITDTFLGCLKKASSKYTEFLQIWFFHECHLNSQMLYLLMPSLLN